MNLTRCLAFHGMKFCNARSDDIENWKHQFCVFVQEKYELMGLQQPGQVEYASWDADRDGVVTLAEWAMALGLRI